jgi:adenosine deaminase
VAFDLAGREAAFPDPLTFKESFDIARSGGLAITLHAGEWGGAAQVRRALEVQPARIAHGGVAVDDPSLCAELAARNVSLDLCPTSNTQAAIVPGYGDFPIAELRRRGVPITLNTDDLVVSDVTLSEEYLYVHRRLGLPVADLIALARAGYDFAFVEQGTKTRLRNALETWLSQRGM